MPSFDISCEFDEHEVNNAVDQANREVATRFDFKGADASFKFSGQQIDLQAESDFHLNQMVEIIKKKMTKRGVDLAHLKIEEPVVVHKKAEQKIILQQGIETDIAKQIVKTIKGAKLKVQAAIQGEQVRVTGKKRDDLQEAISLLKNNDFKLPLQFGNFRD